MPASFQPAQALLLAAGRGNRMRPLTDHTPKPLLAVQGRPLIEWPMRALALQGFVHVLVNTAWLGDQLPQHFGTTWAHDGALPATRLQYSREDIDFGCALETAGGIARALPQLDDVFWLAAGDVHAPGFAFARADYDRFAASDALAHLWMVPNPTHHLTGDFALDADAVLHDMPGDDARLPRYTYSAIGLFRKTLFTPPYCSIAAGNPQGVMAPLAPVLRAAMREGRITGEVFCGRWTDVGTPQRLAQLNALRA